MLLQMALFHCFLWLRIILECVCVLYCTTVLFKVQDCKINFFLYLFFMYYLCEKFYKLKYSTILYLLDTEAKFVGLMNKLDLRMHSQNRTCSHVGNSL